LYFERLSLKNINYFKLGINEHMFIYAEFEMNVFIVYDFLNVINSFIYFIYYFILYLFYLFI